MNCLSLLRRAAVVAAGLLLTFASTGVVRAQSKLPTGLTVTYSSGGASDVTLAPNVWLYVPNGQPPTPFVPGGPFTATWTGYIAVDLRDSYTFQATLNGALKLEINGNPVFDATSDGKESEPSKAVRLNKGTNAFKATFTSPAAGDAFVRLVWSTSEFQPEPVGAQSLVHEATPELEKAEQLRLGRELFAEHRCSKCHAGPKPESAMLELGMDAPTFEGIGTRRQYGWMMGWVLDPKEQRAGVHMPKLLHSPTAQEDASAIAAYLASLKDEAKPLLADTTPELAGAGKELAEKLHCVSCHNLPGDKPDVKKISLEQVSTKFNGGFLAAFLKNPAQHYAWIRMPNLRLSDDEAKQLAAYLLSKAPVQRPVAAPTDAAVLEKGKKLVQTSGCLNCHTHKLDNQFATKSLADLKPAQWQSGCLAEKADGKAPDYGFTSEQRAALVAFGATDRASLTRHVPVEFFERQVRNLNCMECHGKFEGFPILPVLGGKLKPEWTEAFLAGKTSYKPRPWLESRMPIFASRAQAIAQGMTMEHGLPPQTPAEPAVDMAAADIGRKLVGVDGGFSCIACHAVKELGATQVFESAGVNLGWAGERLQHDYFVHWLNNPLRVDPQTKMPMYFDQGRSPLTDQYEGDAKKQINALWQYISLGQKMTPPATP